MPSRNIRYGRIALGVSLLLAGAPASAIFCAVDPIVPPCCPTPCPVFDAIRVPKLLADVGSLRQAIDADAKVVQSMAQVGQTIGDTNTVVASTASGLSTFPYTVSNEVTAIQSRLPTHPVAALGALEQAIFDVGAVGQASASQSAARKSSRIATAQDELAAALALSLSQSSNLPSYSPLQGQMAETVSGSAQLHADFAANSTARLALYQDMGGLHQLVAAWLSHRASSSAVEHPITGGGAIPKPTGVSLGPDSAPQPQIVQSTVDQLIALHDSRVSAQALLGAYPALQQTIARAGLADQFANTAESTLQKSLFALGVGSGTTISSVEQTLQEADLTGWLDSGKDAQARAAGAKMLLALAKSGSISPAFVADGSSAGPQLQQAMASWLDAKKQSQFWSQLALSAQTSIAGLDRRLGALSDYAGVDLTNASAAIAETALLGKLKKNQSAPQVQGVIAAASQDPEARFVLRRAVAQ